MVNYTSSDDCRRKVQFVLAFLSIVLSAVLIIVLSHIEEVLGRWFWLIPQLSVFAIYTGLGYIFNRFLWRYFYFWHGIPDIKGNWEGEGKRNVPRDSENSENFKVRARINQNWTKINLVLRNEEGEIDDTKSRTLAFYIDKSDTDNIIMYDVWEYTGAFGCSKIEYLKNANNLVLDMNYVSSKRNKGRIILKKVDD